MSSVLCSYVCDDRMLCWMWMSCAILLSSSQIAMWLHVEYKQPTPTLTVLTLTVTWLLGFLMSLPFLSAYHLPISLNCHNTLTPHVCLSISLSVSLSVCHLAILYFCLAVYMSASHFIFFFQTLPAVWLPYVCLLSSRVHTFFLLFVLLLFIKMNLSFILYLYIWPV